MLPATPEAWREAWREHVDRLAAELGAQMQQTLLQSQELHETPHARLRRVATEVMQQHQLTGEPVERVPILQLVVWLRETHQHRLLGDALERAFNAYERQIISRTADVIRGRVVQEGKDYFEAWRFSRTLDNLFDPDRNDLWQTYRERQPNFEAFPLLRDDHKEVIACFKRREEQRKVWETMRFGHPEALRAAAEAVMDHALREADQLMLTEDAVVLESIARRLADGSVLQAPSCAPPVPELEALLDRLQVSELEPALYQQYAATLQASMEHQINELKLSGSGLASTIAGMFGEVAKAHTDKLRPRRDTPNSRKRRAEAAAAAAESENTVDLFHDDLQRLRPLAERLCVMRCEHVRLHFFKQLLHDLLEALQHAAQLAPELQLSAVRQLKREYNNTKRALADNQQQMKDTATEARAVLARADEGAARCDRWHFWKQLGEALSQGDQAPITLEQAAERVQDAVARLSDPALPPERPHATQLSELLETAAARAQASARQANAEDQAVLERRLEDLAQAVLQSANTKRSAYLRSQRDTAPPPPPAKEPAFTPGLRPSHAWHAQVHSWVKLLSELLPVSDHDHPHWQELADELHLHATERLSPQPWDWYIFMLRPWTHAFLRIHHSQPQHHED